LGVALHRHEERTAVRQVFPWVPLVPAECPLLRWQRHVHLHGELAAILGGGTLRGHACSSRWGVTRAARWARVEMFRDLFRECPGVQCIFPASNISQTLVVALPAPPGQLDG